MFDKTIYAVLICVLLLTACNSQKQVPEFIQDDSQENLDRQADKALQEADRLLDSLEQTSIINPDL